VKRALREAQNRVPSGRTQSCPRKGDVDTSSRSAAGMAFELEVIRVDESYPEALQREFDSEVARAWPRSTEVVGGEAVPNPA
jgi:hypothetical protein